MEDWKDLSKGQGKEGWVPEGSLARNVLSFERRYLYGRTYVDPEGL